MFDQDFHSYFKKDVLRITEAKNSQILTHLTHLEELALTKKKEGVELALSFIRELLDVLGGNSKSKTYTTRKIDGAPSLIAGINPENGKFFVATKSMANTTPKVNYTNSDIEANHGHAAGLVKKLKLALKYLPAAIKTGIFQGDCMFDRESLFSIEHEGQKYIAFKPNVIVYAVEQDSELADKILAAEFGIVFHTRYVGSSLSDLKQEMGVSVDEFNPTPDVWIDDVKYKDYSGVATFTLQETTAIREKIARIHAANVALNWSNIPENQFQLVNTFINNLIRLGRFVEKPEKEVQEYIKWIETRFDKEIAALKSEGGKAKKQEAKRAVLAGIQKHHMEFLNLFHITLLLAEIKMEIVKKYNDANSTKQFLQEPETGDLKVTAPEGYVAVDHFGNAVKLVNRLEFSRANFTQPKTW